MANDLPNQETDAADTNTAKAIPALPDDALIIIPTRNLVLFPGLVLPITVGRESTVAAVQQAARSGRQVGVLLQRDASAENPGPDDLYRVGTTANILRYMTTPDGAHHIICQGEGRFMVTEMLSGYAFNVARAQRLSPVHESSADIEARMLQLKGRTAEILALLPQAPAELTASLQNITSPETLTDWVVGLMDLQPTEKQEVLQTLDLQQRMDRALALVSHRLEVLRISQDIDERTRNRFAERQREAVLREQLKTIQQQLGDEEDAPSEVAQIEGAVERAGMPEEAKAHAQKELKRLKRMPEAAPDYSMLVTYLEWLTELPWSASTEERIDIADARRILDEEHYGLEKIKRRILEYLAVRKLNPQGKSPILCFAGPPGVGKTSLGQSIAHATGRKFVRVSLGGVHDESEIRGHRRTYIGALPGNIIQGLRKAGTNNPVMMLDEVDKMGAGVHGDPAAALLEVLDPEQNASFRDNYLAVPFDLSKVMFICTANMLETISGPLRDRMEIIQLPGYTEMEKVQIARRYLVARQMEANGLKPEQCEITDAALHALVQRYTREAGVRGLEREIGNTLRHAAMRIAEGTAQRVTIDEADLAAILGAPRFENEVAMRVAVPGVATGLAWTPVGGDILFIEATRTPGGGRLVLTGQLGDVMKESAQAALSLLKTRAEGMGIDPALFERSDIHIHVPAGATPKDGPSAGVAMFSALASLMANRALRHDCAMTGEISLRGLVLPVGGIKEKVLAALRAGIHTVLLPARNRRDVDDVPPDARAQLEFIFLETVDEAIATLMPREEAVAV
ncbi:endopeptidase La [Noviherbaspirillum pedocola]|uniref:Lon protease n=1 Tax=Noviherbaspirillum pedocola TaxID=2801341 RepID=A0A934SYE9_9BURK|nr:endopeptidase La [Noviherbaspirillum pedocola]MBK4735182.1 endopeptidase La [Noviherbaspirillum pedocola]